MKDNQLRREVDARLDDVGVRHFDLSKRVDALEDLRLTVKLCKKCRHDTLHQFHPRMQTVCGIVCVCAEGTGFQKEDYHRCLTCGNAWVHHIRFCGGLALVP